MFYIINPDDVKPYQSPGDSQNYYHADIADNVPKGLRYLSLYYFIILILCVLMVFDPPSSYKERLRK